MEETPTDSSAEWPTSFIVDSEGVVVSVAMILMLNQREYDDGT
jgi:hypothetical protein